jgi:hypothetical protein
MYRVRFESGGRKNELLARCSGKAPIERDNEWMPAIWRSNSLNLGMGYSQNHDSCQVFEEQPILDGQRDISGYNRPLLDDGMMTCLRV